MAKSGAGSRASKTRIRVRLVTARARGRVSMLAIFSPRPVATPRVGGRISTRARRPPRVVIARASSSPDAKKAVVVGAGPAGSLAALYLANLGWHVKVYERRTEAGSDGIRDKGKAAPRPDISYNVVLSPRGMNALDGAGVVLPEERIVRLMGNVRHLPGAAPSMSRQFRGTVAVNRDVLADAIVRTASDKHPGRIEFTRGVGVTDVDFASRVAVFGPSSSEFQGEESTVSEPYDLLVAADGVNSAVRSMLATRRGPDGDAERGRDDVQVRQAAAAEEQRVINRRIFKREDDDGGAN